MIAIDSSVAVAAFAPWHQRHEQALAALDKRPSVPAHGLLECYSVLTRLPAPHRAPGEVVREFIAREFPAATRIALPEREQRALVERLAALGIEGGATYDGLIALTAASAGAELLTLDERAHATYRRCAVEAEILST